MPVLKIELCQFLTVFGLCVQYYLQYRNSSPCILVLLVNNLYSNGTSMQLRSVQTSSILLHHYIFWSILKYLSHLLDLQHHQFLVNLLVEAYILQDTLFIETKKRSVNSILKVVKILLTPINFTRLNIFAQTIAPLFPSIGPHPMSSKWSDQKNRHHFATSVFHNQKLLYSASNYLTSF